MKRKKVIGLVIVLVVILLAAGAVSAALWLTGQKENEDEEKEPEQQVELKLPESEYDVYCVLTEGAIRYGADGESYEIDTWALDANEAMTLAIDTDGVLPRDGYVYRVYVPKNGTDPAIFAGAVVSGGMQRVDFQARPIGSRDSEWLYEGGMNNKYRQTADSVLYYVKVQDGRLRRVEAETTERYAQFNNDCPDHENHAHTNGCYLYNAYVKYTGGFLEPYELTWAILSVDGSSIYRFIGTDGDSPYACLPGQDSDPSRLVVTTGEYDAENRRISVEDLNGDTYTCTVSETGVVPVGGRIYRIDEETDGSLRFSVALREGDAYDYINTPVTQVNGDAVTVASDAVLKVTEDTRIIEAARFWTGWLTLSEVDGSLIQTAERTNACREQGAHTHTDNCYFYNGYYKTDNFSNLKWIMTENTGDSLFATMGGSQDEPWGSGPLEETVLVLSVSGSRITVMDMNGSQHTYSYTAEGVEVYPGALYHMELDEGQNAVITKASTSYTEPGFDVVRAPLCRINGDELIFGDGEYAKETHLTDETRIYYMAVGDHRLIPVSSGQLQVAQRTAGCMERGSHVHDNNCYYSNALFGCDGQGNLKWVIMSAKNGSLWYTLGDAENKLSTDVTAKTAVALTLSAMRGDGTAQVLLPASGQTVSYPVDQSGLIPAKGRIYAYELRNGKIYFKEPNADGANNFSRGGILEAEEGLVTIQSRESFRVTEDTRIYTVDVVNGKLVPGDTTELALCQPTTYCKSQASGHVHNWSRCYSSNAAYATDGAGNLLWMVVRADGEGISGYLGSSTSPAVAAGSPSKVLFTTSHLEFKSDGSRWIEGMTMDGTKVSYALAENSLLPVKGSIYHMELVDGKALLSAPDKDHRVSGYDLGSRPLQSISGDTLVLPAGERYLLTERTKIYNIEMVGGVLVLTDTTELPAARLNCAKDHTHTNDCYTYNLYFAADENDELLWVMAAPSDTAIFSKTGMDASSSTDSGDPASVVVTLSHAYPEWENGGKKTVMDVMDMTGTKRHVQVKEGSLLPAYGKGYHMELSPDGTAEFSVPETRDVPTSAGYDFARYRVTAVNGDQVQLQNGTILTITSETKIFNGDVENNRLVNIEAGGTVVPSARTESCPGGNHDHVSGCFIYSAWYAADGDGNLKWILTQREGDKSIYSAQARETDLDLRALETETGFVLTTGPARADGSGTLRVSAEDIYGTKYTNAALNTAAENALVPYEGYGYQAAAKDGELTLSDMTGQGVARYVVQGYENGILSVNTTSGSSPAQYRVSPNTLIRYAQLQNGKLRFVEGSGIPAGTATNAWIRLENGYVSWMVVEVEGSSIYSYFGTGLTRSAEPRNVVLTTGYAYPEWTADGTRLVKVPVTDMEGTEEVLTLSGDMQAPVPGKLYMMEKNSDGTATLTLCSGTDVSRARVKAADLDAGTVKVEDGSGSRTLDIAENAYLQVVTSDTGQARRMTLEEEGIGRTGTDNYCAIYGVNEANEIVFLLSERDANSIWYGVAGVENGLHDTLEVEPLAADTGVVIVTEADYETKTAVLQDVSGSEPKEVTVELSERGACWPLAGYAYKAEIEDGRATLTVLWDSAVEAADLKTDKVTGYADGVLTGDTAAASRNHEYKITSNTHILFVTRENGLILGITTEGAGFAAGSAYNAFVKADPEGYAQWVVVETKGESIYSNLGKYFPVTGDAGNVVLTLGEAYPVWEDGVRYNEAAVRDMTGAERTLRLSEESILPVSGKLYGISAEADGAVTLYAVPYSGDGNVRMGRLSAKSGSALTLTSSNDTTAAVTVPADCYQQIVTVDASRSGDARITGMREGIGTLITDNSRYNALYGVNEMGQVTWILTGDNDSSGKAVSLYYALGRESDAYETAAPDFAAAPIAFVTKAPYLNEAGYYVVDLEDIYGQTYEGLRFDEGAEVYPKEDEPYVVMIQNGVADFVRFSRDIVESDGTVSYEKGVLTGITRSSGTAYTYHITANTHIVYVTRSGNTLRLATEEERGDLAAAGFDLGNTAYSCLLSNGVSKASAGDYVQWMLVEVTNQSLYNLSQDPGTWAGYSVTARATRSPGELALITSDIIWDSAKESYQVDAVDMTGAERTLSFAGTEGQLPINGKVYRITETAEGYRFDWAGQKNYSAYGSTDIVDLLRQPVIGYDAQAGTITLSNNRTLKLAEDVKILSVSRKSGSNLADYEGLVTEIITAKNNGSSGSPSYNWNGIFGLNRTGEVVWILNCNTDGSIYYIAESNNTQPPTLPDKTAAASFSLPAFLGLDPTRLWAWLAGMM